MQMDNFQNLSKEEQDALAKAISDSIIKEINEKM